MYHQDFVQGSQPDEIVINTFGTPNGAVQWELGPSPKMWGWATIPVDVGTTVHEGRCLTVRAQYLRRTRDKIRFRWFHFEEPKLRYHLGIFKTMSHADTARVALCWNGTELGMLRSTPTNNIFTTFGVASTNQTVYECELEMVSGGVKLELYDSTGALLGTITKTTEIPDQNEVMRIGACVWAGDTITAGTELNLDSINVDIRS